MWLCLAFATDVLGREQGPLTPEFHAQIAVEIRSARKLAICLAESIHSRQRDRMTETAVRYLWAKPE